MKLYEMAKFHDQMTRDVADMEREMRARMPRNPTLLDIQKHCDLMRIRADGIYQTYGFDPTLLFGAHP